MKKLQLLFAGLAIAAAAGLGSCARDVNSEANASSPSAAEFNRRTYESTLDTDDSVGRKGRKERPPRIEGE